MSVCLSIDDRYASVVEPFAHFTDQMDKCVYRYLELYKLAQLGKKIMGLRSQRVELVKNWTYEQMATGINLVETWYVP